MIVTDEEFTKQDIAPMIDLLRERDPKQADYIEKQIKEHTKINNAAREFIDDNGLVECCALASVMARENGKLNFVLEIGWQVGGRSGVASYLNSLSSAALKKGDIQSAVMMRVFAICSYEFVIEHVEQEDIDEIVTEMYAMTIDKPTDKQWDIARANIVTSDIENESDWNQAKEQEENDDQLD